MTASNTDSKLSMVDEIESQLSALGIEVIAKNISKPWGAFLVINEDQATEFADHYFPGIDLSTLKIAGRLSPKILFVAPSKRLSWQYHHRRAEIWRVISGKVGIALSESDTENTPLERTAGEIIRIAKGERHRLVGLGDWGVIAEIWQHTDAAHPSDENDIVRVQDDFGR